MPAGLAWMADAPRMQSWLATLPSVVDRAVERWSLALGAPYAGSHVSWTAPARRDDGSPVVLKVQFPHPECAHEADALRHWNGDGAVRLLDHDCHDHALLVERCLPGAHLSASGAGSETVLGIVTDLLRRLLVPATMPFGTLIDEAAGWTATLLPRWEAAGRPFDRRLVEAAVAVLGDLASSASGEPVLLHQDLHGDNVCAAERQPWLAIDPKPVVGDAAFAPAPIVRSHELGGGRAATLRRLDALVDGLGLDAARVAGWAFGQTVAWSIDDESGGAHARHVETAGWLLERLEVRS